MAQIHPTALIESGARIGDDVYIGPYCVVGAEVELGHRVRLESHVAVAGRTSIGDETRIFPFASIGHPPQDLKYKGEPSRLVIGKRNTIREFATMNPGTEGGGMLTSVGDDCLFMACAHVAHDVHIGNRVVVVNNVLLGGHMEIGDFAVIGAGAAMHQFVRIGPHAMVGGMAAVDADVIPYGTVIGNRAYLNGLNLVGLRRRGFDREAINQLREAYRLIFAPEGTLTQRTEDAAARFAGNSLVQDVAAFIRKSTSRGICQPKPDAVLATD